MEMTTIQEIIQEVINYNKMMDEVPKMLDKMTIKQKQEMSERIELKKQEIDVKSSLIINKVR